MTKTIEPNTIMDTAHVDAGFVFKKVNLTFYVSDASVGSHGEHISVLEYNHGYKLRTWNKN